VTLTIPDRVRRNAEARGQSGWLASLPERVRALERRWDITIGATTRNATEAFVALARTADGVDAAVKMVIPGIDPTRQQIRVLRAASGRGYVKLLRADEDENVLLLERLGDQLIESGLSLDQQIGAICATLQLAWMPPPEGPAFVTGAAKALELGAIIEENWAKFGKPCSERTFDRALSFAQSRTDAFDPAEAVLVHGDAHFWNTLAAPGSETGYKFVDPDGAFAERAFDLAIPMREWMGQRPDGDLLQRVRERCKLLVDLTGVAAQPIWEWSVLQLVSNALLNKQIGTEDPLSFEIADVMTAGSALP
jgi:streptomycin 6-kinase